MSLKVRDLVLGAMTVVALVAGAVLVVWSSIGPAGGPQETPGTFADLRDGVRSLTRRGDFDRAESLVSAYLERHPSDDLAAIMAAELAIDRPNPDPQRALERLAQVHSQDARVVAQVQLDTGKAQYRLGRYDAAEHAWLEALRLAPTIPEAGWALLDLYYVQGRQADAHRLAMQQFEVEPDPHDRVHLLLELVRQDVEPSAPGSVVQWYGPIVRDHPEELRATLALGLAQVYDSQAETGLAHLRRAADTHPDRPEAWQAWLAGLSATDQHEELARVVARLPVTWAANPAFARYRGQVAQDQRDWSAAAAQYRLAHEADSHDHEVLYRLGQVLRHAKSPEADLVEARARAFEASREELRAAYNEASESRTLGEKPDPRLCRRLADLREKMGRPDEARAWRSLGAGGVVDPKPAGGSPRT